MVEIVKLTPRAGSPRPPLPAVRPAPFDPLAALLAETATGHERALARLYELVGGRLFAVARGILGRADLAEDVLQESFLRIWRSAHQYDRPKARPMPGWSGSSATAPCRRGRGPRGSTRAAPTSTPNGWFRPGLTRRPR